MAAKTEANTSTFVVMGDYHMVIMNGQFKSLAFGTRVSDLFCIWGPRAYILQNEGLGRFEVDDPSHVLQRSCVYELKFHPIGSVKGTLPTAPDQTCVSCEGKVYQRKV